MVYKAKTPNLIPVNNSDLKVVSLFCVSVTTGSQHLQAFVTSRRHLHSADHADAIIAKK